MPSYKHVLPILYPSYTSNTDTTDYTFPAANSHSIHSFLPLLYYLCTSTQRYPHSEPSECPSSRISPGHAIIPIVSTSLASHPSPALPHRARRPHHFLSSHSSNITIYAPIEHLNHSRRSPPVTKVLKGPKVLKVLIRAYRLRAQRRFQIPHSTHSSNITPIIPIVPIVPIAPTSLRPSAGNARAQPNSTFDIIMAFRIRHYKMSPGGIRCRMPPGRLKVAVTYSPTFAVPSA